MKRVSSLKLALVAATLFVGVSTPIVAFSDMTDWRREVVRAVAQKQQYPRSAQLREIEGKAKIRLVISADGTITAHEVVEPTGQPILDNEIPKLVARLNPLPPLPEGQTDLKLVLPLEWALQ
ncbi:MAG: TonB family protein [Alphaproteobacteria bacterium]|nr:TonB family protein [Alphaproteobacteria bacterium]